MIHRNLIRPGHMRKFSTYLKNCKISVPLSDLAAQAMRKNGQLVQKGTNYHV